MIGTLETLASFIVSPAFIAIWCVGLAVYGTLWAVPVFRQTTFLRRQLHTAGVLLSRMKGVVNYRSQFPALSHQMLNLENLKQTWQEYCLCLVEEKRDDSGREPPRLRSLKDPTEAFNSTMLLNPMLNLSRIEGIPAHMSSLGILGTFIGLAAGIFLARKGLVGGGVEEIQASLTQLLNGAALAFWTSIAGILCSLVYSRMEKLFLGNLEETLNRFNYCLRTRIPILAKERQSEQLMKDLSEQNRILKDLVHRMNGFDGGLGDTVKQIGQLNQDMLKLTKELDHHMSRGMLSLAGAVGDLNQVVQNLPSQKNPTGDS